MKAKKLLSILLTLAVIGSSMAFPVLATETSEVTETVDTFYSKDGDFILDLEFNSPDEYADAIIEDPYNKDLAATDLVSIDNTTYQDKSAGKFLNTTRNSLKFKGDKYTSLKAALEEGPVAFEFSFLQPQGNGGEIYFVGYNTLFNTYNTTGLQFAKGAQPFWGSLKADNWNTVTTVLDYSSGTVDVDAFTINGEAKNITCDLTAIDTVEKLLSDNAFGVYFTENNSMYTYMDYIRIYKVATSKETEYARDGSFLLDLEFNKESEYINATVRDDNNTSLTRSDLLSIDNTTYEGKSVGKFLNSTRNGLIFTGKEYTDLKAALENGPVVFEFNFLQPTTDKKAENYFVGLKKLFFTYNNHMQFAGAKQSYWGSLTENFNTLTAVLDYSSGTLEVKEMKVNGAVQTVAADNLSAIDSIDELLADKLDFYFTGGSGAYTYVDYIRIYKLKSEQAKTKYLKDGDFLLDLEFDYASEYKNATISDWDKTPNLLTIDASTYPDKSVGKFLHTRRTAFTFKGEEYTNLKSALENGPVAFEFSFLQPEGNTGGVYFVGYNTLCNTYKTTGLQFAKGKNGFWGTLTADSWNTVTAVLDYSSGSLVVKEFTINGEVKETTTDLDGIGTVDKLLTDSDNNGLLGFYFTDNNAMHTYMDYIRIYKVKSEQVSTVYKKSGDFILDLEFENTSEYKNAVISDWDKTPNLLTIDASSYADKSVGKFLHTRRTSFTFKGEEYTNLKTALENGPVAFEISYNKPSENKGDAYFVGLSKLFTSYSNQGTIRFSGNEQGYQNVAPAGEWNKLTAVLDYSSDTLKINQITVNGVKMNVDKNKLTTIDTVDELLHDSALSFYFSGENQYTYVDYIRIYNVETVDCITKVDGTLAESFNEATTLNLAAYDVAAGECVVIAYYNSDNLLVGVETINVSVEDFSDGVISKNLNKPGDAVNLKVFVFKNEATLEPSDVLPIIL